MKELPMLFRGPLVKAIQAGHKTQTRRPVRKSNSHTGAGYKFDDLDLNLAWHDHGFPDEKGQYRSHYLKAPVVRGPNGDDEVVDRVYCRFTPEDCWDYEAAEQDGMTSPGCRIWVKETWCQPSLAGIGTAHPAYLHEVLYAADEGIERHEGHRNWHQRNRDFKWKASIHMPRLASRITLDVEAIRVERLQDITAMGVFKEGIGSFASAHIDVAREMFAQTWNQIHGNGAWHDNPWVWVIEFSRVDKDGE